MIKPDRLRRALELAAPTFLTNPDALKMWVDKGRIVARRGANRAFEYRYTLSVVITDWTGHPSLIFLAINEWLEGQQPELVTAGREESYTFEADIIDSQTIDLQIDLNLSEPVIVTDSGGGNFELVHLPEPSPLLADMEGLTAPTVPLTSIWWHGQKLVPQPAP